jgi:hypothetical protein
MTERSGIEIDYCPDCRGVWLDRGELDKIIERSSTTIQKDQFSEGSRSSKDNDYRYKKKKGLLGDLFDF